MNLNACDATLESEPHQCTHLVSIPCLHSQDPSHDEDRPSIKMKEGQGRIHNSSASGLSRRRQQIDSEVTAFTLATTAKVATKSAREQLRSHTYLPEHSCRDDPAPLTRATHLHLTGETHSNRSRVVREIVQSCRIAC